MFSDNENPGAELSAGQSATAATPAPEHNRNRRDTEATIRPRLKRKNHVAAAAPSAAEPAAVTVAPAEPVAAPDGPAAVEHSDVSEMVEAAVDAGEPSTESNVGDGTAHGAVRRAASGAGGRRN